jgi:CelD/BcsL family acetyltransferase involved in cellulose biosynthesis
MTSVEIIDDLGSAEALAPAWDELAVANSLPLCAPAWMLAWWRHVAPSGSSLRIVALRDGSETFAIAPWFVQTDAAGRIDLRFLGAELSDRVDILCSPGREREAATTLRRAIASLRPRPHLVAFEAVPMDSGWTTRLASGLSGRMQLSHYRNSARPAPYVTLPRGNPEQWLAGRSSKFSKHMRRQRRLLEQRGGVVRHVSEQSEVRRMLNAMLRLHAERWDGRETSGLARPGLLEMLCDASLALGTDRLRLWTVELDGEPISVQLFLAGGAQVKFWNGGWSERHADLQPSMLTILSALEDAISRGEQRLDMGAGIHPYKLRFADGQDTLAWEGVILRGRRWPRTRAEFVPMTLRYRAKRLVGHLPKPLHNRAEAIWKARGRTAA